MELLQEYTLLDSYPVRRYGLDNGLQALLLQNPVSSVAAYLTLYTVGSASEHDGQRGLAHFFEHMMFRETEKLKDGDFDRVMSEIGGVGLNAFTSYDATAYHVNVPARQLGRVIELEADRMVNLRLSPDLIERERGAVLGEMKMYKDMPSEQLWETVMAAAFRIHPYRHPIIGYMEQVEGFRDEDFSRFYRQHYAPNRAVVVIAGGFDEGEAVQLLERAYGGLAPGPPPAEATAAGPQAAAAEPEDSVREEIGHGKITTENLVIAARTPGLTSPDTPALLMLAALLSAGQSSPLYRRLVLDGLTTHVSANLLETEMMLVSSGLLVIEAGMQHGVASEAAEAAIGEVLDGLLREGIPPDELERARNQVLLSFYSGMRSNMSLARHIGGYAVVCGDPLFGQRMLKAVQDVSADEVRGVLRRYLVAAPLVTVVQRPRAEGQAS